MILDIDVLEHLTRYYVDIAIGAIIGINIIYLVEGLFINYKRFHKFILFLAYFGFFGTFMILSSWYSGNRDLLYKDYSLTDEEAKTLKKNDMLHY